MTTGSTLPEVFLAAPRTGGQGFGTRQDVDETVWILFCFIEAE